MSTIHSFKAIRPAPPHAAEVSCPPYDVISTDEARVLAEGRDGSFLHVIRPGDRLSRRKPIPTTTPSTPTVAMNSRD